MSRSGQTATGPLAAAVVALVVLAAAWAGLYRGIGGGRLILLCAVGALPAIAALAPRARGLAVALAAALAVPAALALATRGSPWALITLDADAWSVVGAIVPDGLAAGSDAGLPVSAAAEPALVALLDIALVLMAAAAAWQIVVRRRPVLGLIVVGVGLAYRWTVEPPASGVAAGALSLAALTVVLALSGWEASAPIRPLRHVAGAIVLGGVTVAMAAGVGAGPAQAGHPLWNWKQWEIGGPGGSGSAGGGGLDLRQRYGKLQWPSTPRVVATVESERALSLRAISLQEFDGIAFALSETGGSAALPIVGGTLTLAPDPVGPLVSQRVTLVGVSSPVLLAAGRPERVTGLLASTADLVGDGIRLDTSLDPGETYSLRTRVPRPGPADLVNAGPYEPASVPPGSTQLRAVFYGTPVDTPLWGSGAPAPADAALGVYSQVRELARRVVGDAATPYAAVNRIEAYLRSRYVYDEAPPYPTALPPDWPTDWPGQDPPLVDFLFGSRRGFCQHFAGSMAVMLRSLGIPARVAVGYTGGSYDSAIDRWRVLDRDAHSWVEVWFPGYGWLPFDPTPGRSAANPASVSSPDYAPTRREINLGGIADAAVDPPSPATTTPPRRPAVVTPAGTAPAGDGGGGPDRRWALLLLALPAAFAPGRRALRRIRGRRGGDERSRVVAATRELETALVPLGWTPSPASSLSERAESIRVRTGVDPSDLYRRASVARFAPAPPPPGAAAAAWRDAGRMRREIRRGAPRSRRVLAALGIPAPVRDTVG